ncbi:MAG: hypothetical protein EZS28_036813 [Streblomastix strix]|uniref:Uncharacterized protein n=1 Tax=Streblomastix strix TaxID=222440 RepID=A0A5J4UCM5_9EUKA|nr:MAG: hypothetical protein EZS28_036813 [Streblomastix strix]
MDASSSRWGAALIGKNLEKVYAHGELKDNHLKSSNLGKLTAIQKTLIEFHQELILQKPIGIHLLTNITVTMYCLNKGKGSITISPLIDNVLNLSKLSRCGDYSIKGEILQKALKGLRIKIFINVFEAQYNRKCKRYCSASKDKFAVKRNGFNLEWTKELTLLFPNFITTKDNQESQERENPSFSVDCARLAKPEVVHRAQRDHEVEDILKRGQASLTDGRETSKQMLDAAIRIDLPFFVGNKDVEKLFLQLLYAGGLTSKAVDRLISNWSGKWRTHISSLTLLAAYTKKSTKSQDICQILSSPRSSW